MALLSFVGRVLFASVFILSAWQEFNEFGVDGGPAAKALKPKFNVLSKSLTSHTGLELPEFDIKYLVAAAVAFKGVGGLLFIFGSTMGAYLLALQQVIATPILYDFYNYDTGKKEFDLLFPEFTQVKRGSAWGITLLHRHEELTAQETAQEKGGSENQNILKEEHLVNQGCIVRFRCCMLWIKALLFKIRERKRADLLHFDTVNCQLLS
ncbi:hypothetical protein GQ457_09G020490 [Hibiscus cannabinus]